MSRFTLCNCPVGFSAAPERHAPDCPGRSGAGKTRISEPVTVQVRDTHADASEVERMRADIKRLHEADEFLDAVAQGVEDNLRAQLAERDALLAKFAEFLEWCENADVGAGYCVCGDDLNRHSTDHSPVDMWSYNLDLWAKELRALSASADRSAPVERPQLVGEDELQDLAASACQMALSHGVSEDSFLRLARTVEQRARAKLNGGA